MTVAALMDIGAASLIIAWACLVVSSDWARGRVRPRRAVPGRSRREARRAARATRRRLVVEQLERWDEQYKAITAIGAEPEWVEPFGWITAGARPVQSGITSADACERLVAAMRHAGGAW